MSPSHLRIIIGGAVVALLIALSLLEKREGRRAEEREPEHATVALEAKRARADLAPGAQVGGASVTGAAAPRAPRHPSAEDREYRRRVLEGLRARERSEHPPSAAAGGRVPPAEGEPRGAVDRTGELAEEVRIMNREFLPFVGECIEQSSERNPRLKGMLEVNLMFATDEDIGAIVEEVEAGPGNELRDDELIECVRQSAFTLRLPAARLSGREGLMLTVPHRIDAGAPVPERSTAP